MRTLWRAEWKRAWSSWYCKCMLILSLVWAMASAAMSFWTHKLYQWENGLQQVEDIYPVTITEVWFGMDITTIFNELYMLVFPILAVIPYVSLVYDDYKNGYLNQMLIRVDRVRYFSVRYMVNFLMGGIGVTLPSVLNLLIGALFAPVIPQLEATRQCAIMDRSFAADLFFDRVELYILLYLVIEFIWGGIFANFAAAFADCIRNRYVMLALPFLVHVVSYYIVSTSKLLEQMHIYEYIPYRF